MKITRRMWGMAASAVLALNLGLPAAQAAEEAPDALVKRVSADVLETIKKDASLRNGDSSKINALVNEKVMPYVDFRRMTSAAVGPAWRQATPEQRQKLQDEFKALLIRTYAGALSQVGDQTITVKPVRMAAGDTDVLVRTQVNGRGDPVQLDFRLEKQATGWKLYNFNVLGVWLVETYRNQFAQEINANGIDGLIKTLASRSSMPATATK
ncbi:UNVERIFIED_CONTAM: ABC transporter substrate-binding protein [Comamonas sp. A-3]|uniref:ABC transporter substrate-binding protein n=1 Tax=Comamonas thiooxydans TaxID=363952 RepID=A0AA42Q0Z8_9BURK|nr:ABC transporter substrate-binding protein [Comamonas thiooxydans]MDH1254579.1 ABC transporter substrate-binding protein [Comamonas thiooxydans]MDH1333831.1 ABC transporter substrate-binding protein [Comamonas thiooxydans]MDH1473832.1 ABC transporter substrate-binding protein [Comamonas thiooxydans]MDH1741652.1 ABC transporter substrate-binding protein [Comamonas thiooxydans]MDH1785536.1 ABC transporter substrate-binding protein [Comamonas thiooxydans]